MAVIQIQDLLDDLNFYSKQFVNPPQIIEAELQNIWLDEVVKIVLNIGEREVTRQAIVPRTQVVMHHQITVYGPNNRSIEEVEYGVAEKAIRYWINHRYWELAGVRP